MVLPSLIQTMFLWGLGALAVPLIIHLFFRLKTKRVELGTIRFLQVVLEENARRRNIMRWILLALRLAAVALLALLFARPFLSADAGKSEKEHLVILIDRSATMQLKGENGRLIDQAIGAARRIIESSATESRIDIAFFDHQVRPVNNSGANADAAKSKNGTGAGSATAAAKALVEADRSSERSDLYGSTNFGAAFAWARDLLTNASRGKKTLHVFTDMQRSGLDWSEVEPFPPDVRAHLHNLGHSVVNNISITEASTPRGWVRPGETMSVHTSIAHGGAFAIDEVPIVLEVGRVPATGDSPSKGSQRKVVEFDKLADRYVKRERVKLEPGATVTLDFELPTLSEGTWQGRVTVEYDDELAFDNQRYFAVASAPAYSVLVLTDGARESVPIHESYFLEAAVRLASPNEEFIESPFRPEVREYKSAESLAGLEKYDSVILVNIGAIAKSTATALAEYVKRGGGLLVFTGDSITNASCKELGELGLSVGKIGEIQITRDLPWRITEWDGKHPIFEPFQDPQYGDLKRLIFAAYTKITPAADVQVLASYKSGDPAVIERHVGAGSVVWVTTSCGRDWGDWSTSRLFVPLVHQMLGYQVGLTDGGRVRSLILDKANELRPSVSHYSRHTVVANVSPSESDTEHCTQTDLEDRFGIQFIDDDNQSKVVSHTKGDDDIHPNEMWHWIACVLLGTVLLEGFVGNRTTA